MFAQTHCHYKPTIHRGWNSFHKWLRTGLGRSVWVTAVTPLVWLNRLRAPNLPTDRNSRVINRTQIKKFVNNPPYRDWGPTANQIGEVIQMWYTDIYCNIIEYQKYIGRSIKVGCATRSLYASSGLKAVGVPTNNKRGRGSGPCHLWGCLDKARHIVPTALLVRVQRLRNTVYKAVKGPITRPIVVPMITGSYWRRRTRFTIFDEMKFVLLLTILSL